MIGLGKSYKVLLLIQANETKRVREMAIYRERIAGGVEKGFEIEYTGVFILKWNFSQELDIK